MGLIENIERGLEKTVRKVFTAGTKRRIEPVDLASRMRAEMDKKSYIITEGRTLAPNVFDFEFSESDFPRAQDWGQELAEELCDVAIRHARSQGYTLRGAVRVSFVLTEDPELGQGEFTVVSAQERSGRHPQEPRSSAHAQSSNATVHGDARGGRASSRPHQSHPEHSRAADSSPAPAGYSPSAAVAPETTPAATPDPQIAALSSAAGAGSGAASATGMAETVSRAASGGPQTSRPGNRPVTPRRNAPRPREASIASPTSTAHSSSAISAGSGVASAGASANPIRPAAQVNYKPVLDINGQRFSIQAKSIVLGRSSDADITVEDTGVSRHHLEILNQDGVFLAVDLGSTNGSQVDGTRLTGRRELVNGTVITMGRTKIVFRLLAPRSSS